MDIEKYFENFLKETQKHEHPVVSFNQENAKQPFLLTQFANNIGNLSQEEFFIKSMLIAKARKDAWEEIEKKSPGTVLYTNDHHYLASTTAWDSSARKYVIYEEILEHVPKHLHVTDLGCATGMTGMLLLMHGYEHITFCDFEGIQLDFLRMALPNIPIFEGRWDIVSYGNEMPCDVVITLDVIEHVGKHLNFLRWVSELSKRAFVLSYPLMEVFDKPYEFAVDGWVDDEVIGSVINARHEIILWEVQFGGRLAIAKHRDGSGKIL